MFGDDRGFFLESYNQRTFADLGIARAICSGQSFFSGRNVVRGLHYQIRQPQGKLVRAITGEILDVALDLRRSSPPSENGNPSTSPARTNTCYGFRAGFAHGFRVVSQTAHVLYKTTDFYAPNTNALWLGTILR